MNLRPDSVMFGVAAPLLVVGAKALAPHEDGFTIEDFCRELGATEEEAGAVLRSMAKAGWVMAGQEPDTFLPLEGFRKVAAASLSDGLTRVEAERLLQRVVEKAKQIQADEANYLAVPTCIVVFGSYLTAKPHLGDLDLGLAVRYRPEVSRDQTRREVRRHLSGGVSSEAKVYVALRLRRPSAISVHTLAEVLELGTPYRVVYGSLPDR